MKTKRRQAASLRGSPTAADEKERAETETQIAPFATFRWMALRLLKLVFAVRKSQFRLALRLGALDFPTPSGRKAGDGSLDPLVSPHRWIYARLCDARDSAQSAHYALEEGEYRSTLIYIAEAETALSEARKLIEPEIRTNEKLRRCEQEPSSANRKD